MPCSQAEPDLLTAETKNLGGSDGSDAMSVDDGEAEKADQEQTPVDHADGMASSAPAHKNVTDTPEDPPPDSAEVRMQKFEDAVRKDSLSTVEEVLCIYDHLPCKTRHLPKARFASRACLRLATVCAF